MIQKLSTKLNDRKKDNKGFTLVELIVVIVILAILAAILIPGLLKWIDEAKNKQYELEARSIYMATQAMIAERYIAEYGVDNPVIGETISSGTKLDYIKKLSGLDVMNVSFIFEGGGSVKINSFETKFTPSAGGDPITMSWTAGGQWEKVTTP